jgi:serine/threonine protein kinase
LKPLNILFKDGNCKIANLGLGESNEKSQEAGSKEYKAPELKKMTDQERINLSLDSLIKIDIYALGMILF